MTTSQTSGRHDLSSYRPDGLAVEAVTQSAGSPMPKMPPLNPLHVFHVAARSGSFSRAAQEMGVTQSTLEE